MDYKIQLLMAFFGSLGFALMFNLRKRFLLEASVSGMFCWIVFLISRHYNLNLFVSAMLAGIWTSASAEFLARIRKTPANQFLIIALMPLVPGGMLYRTLEFFIQGNLNIAYDYSRQTMSYALGIAVGISLVYAVQDMLQKIITK